MREHKLAELYENYNYNYNVKSLVYWVNWW